MTRLLSFMFFAEPQSDLWKTCEFELPMYSAVLEGLVFDGAAGFISSAGMASGIEELLSLAEEPVR